MDRLKIALAVGCVVLGVCGYYYFADTALVLRFLMVVGGLLAGAGVAWLSQPGKEFFAFAQESWAGNRPRSRGRRARKRYRRR